MNKAQIIAYLVDVEGMTKDEAEAKLEGLSPEDKEALEAKIKKWADSDDELSGENDDDDKLSEEDKAKKKLAFEAKEKDENEEKEKKAAKLTAAKSDITKLSTDFRATTEAARLAASKGRIITRLSKLRAQAKITPAEVKKIDLVKLSASSQEAIDAVLHTYESREPVIHLGQMGTTKAENLSEHQAKTRMSRLEAETRANMPMLARSDKGKRLAEGEGAPRGIPAIDSSPPVPDTSSYEADYGHICSMIDQGNAIGAKDFLKKLLEKIALGGQSDDFTESNTLETENQLSALAESVQKMQTQFDTLSKLASSLVG